MTLADFCLLPIIAYLVFAALRGTVKSEAKLGASIDVRRKKLWAVGIGLGLWLTITALAAAEGLLLDLDAFPPPVVRIAFPSLLIIFVVAFSSVGKRFAAGLSYPQLIGFQIFRLPLEIVLLAYFLEGRIPIEMTFEGRNLDIITALTALLVAPMVARGRAGKGVIWAWNIMGFGLLLNVMYVALATMPGRWRVYTEGPPNTLPFFWPSVWVLLCVFLALLGHLILFRRLLRRQEY